MFLVSHSKVNGSSYPFKNKKHRPFQKNRQPFQLALSIRKKFQPFVSNDLSKWKSLVPFASDHVTNLVSGIMLACTVKYCKTDCTWCDLADKSLSCCLSFPAIFCSAGAIPLSYCATAALQRGSVYGLWCSGLRPEKGENASDVRRCCLSDVDSRRTSCSWTVLKVRT